MVQSSEGKKRRAAALKQKIVCPVSQPVIYQSVTQLYQGEVKKGSSLVFYAQSVNQYD